MEWVFLPQILYFLYLFNEVSKTDDFFFCISSELTVNEMNLSLGIGTLLGSFFCLFLFFITDVYYLFHHSFKPLQGFLKTKI